MSAELTIARALSGKTLGLSPKMANRHGLIAGATGTGKTVSLQSLAEQFSMSGVPVFLADVKGDLAGLAARGEESPRIAERLKKLGIPSFEYKAQPVCFWDVYGAAGHPVRTTVSEMGPILLGRILDLNETQEQVLQMAFKIADDQGQLLLDLKDLRALLTWLREHLAELKAEYGNIAEASVGAILRNVINLEEAGGERFFGEPALDIRHLMRQDLSGNGIINILDASKLLNDPRLYATFLLWLLSELFEELDEVGDQDKPRLIFFFDEAHLLFDEAPNTLVQKIEQVVRLIRSKGVGVYFVTQNPLDIPDKVLAQLGNRVQHALRAFTPRDQKAVRAAAETFASNPDVDVAKVITELEVGEALVSLLDSNGRPTPVERAYIIPPHSRIGTLTVDERAQVMARSPNAGLYDRAIDRESAFEVLRGRSEEKQAAPQSAENTPARRDAAPAAPSGPSMFESIFGSSSRRQGVAESFIKSMVRQIGSTIGREIIRGVLGSTSSTRRR